MSICRITKTPDIGFHSQLSGYTHHDVSWKYGETREETDISPSLPHPVVAALLLIGGVELNPGPHENMETASQSIQSLRVRLVYEMEQLKLVEQRLGAEEQQQFLTHQKQEEEIIKLERDLHEERKVNDLQFQELKETQNELEGLRQRLEVSQQMVVDFQLLIKKLEARKQLAPSEYPSPEHSKRKHDASNMQELLGYPETWQSCGDLAFSGSTSQDSENYLRLSNAPPKDATAMEDKSNKYKKLKGADMSGQLFEVKLAALLFLRGVNYMEDFFLASNFEVAGSFDDLMFE